MKALQIIVIASAVILLGCDRATKPSTATSTTAKQYTNVEFIEDVDNSFNELVNKNFALAKEQLIRANSHYPDDPLAANNLAGLLLRDGNFAESRKLLDGASKTPTGYVINDILLAFTFQKKGFLGIFYFCKRHDSINPEQIQKAWPLEKQLVFTKTDGVYLMNTSHSPIAGGAIEKVIEQNLSVTQED